MTVEDVIRIDANMLRLALTAEDVIRLMDVLPRGEPLRDLIEVEMREQGLWDEEAVYGLREVRKGLW